MIKPTWGDGEISLDQLQQKPVNITWTLYGMDDQFDWVSNFLNLQFNLALQRKLTAQQTARIMIQMMEAPTPSKYGTADSTTYHFLGDLLNYHFHYEEGPWEPWQSCAMSLYERYDIYEYTHFTVQNMAGQLRVSETRVRSWIKAGMLPARREKGKLYVKHDVFDFFCRHLETAESIRDLKERLTGKAA